MTQLPPAKPLSIGAYRFVGNISMGTSVSDILAHVGEVLDAAEAMVQLRRNCLSSGRTGGEVIGVVIKAMSGDVSAETELGVHLPGDGPSELQPQGSGAVMNGEKTASPFLPFVNKVKTSLLEEKGLYKKFLDLLTDFRQLRFCLSLSSASGLSQAAHSSMLPHPSNLIRATNLKTLVSVFQLFHRHKQLLSEFCQHVLQVSTIPTAYFMPRGVHLERFKIPTKPHASELTRNKHFETLKQGPTLAATALSVFDPNGTHSVHLSMTSRMRKPNLSVKTLKTARNNSSASARNLDGPMSAPLPQRPQRRKDSNASLSSNPPGSTCSSGNESGSGNNSEATVPKGFPRRVTRASHGQLSVSGSSPVAPLVPETAFKPVTRRTRSTPLGPEIDAPCAVLDPSSPCVSKKPSSPCISQFPAIIKLPAPIQRDTTPVPTEIKTLKRPASSASSSSTTSLEFEMVVSKRSKTTPKPQTATAPLIQKQSLTEPRVLSKSNQEPKPNLETSILTPYALATRLFEPSIPLPSAPNSSDPPMQKMDRNSIEYIMNAMLNHQCATLFRDSSSESKSTNTSRRTSGANSPPSTITDTASTISLDISPGAQQQTTANEMKSVSYNKLFNLNRMSERLKAGFYSSHVAFKRDFDGMMANFRERNAFLKRFEEGKMEAGSMNELVKFSEFEKEELDFELVAAERLERYFANEWTHFFPAITGKRSRGGKGANDVASPLEIVAKKSRR
ncbi:hypothetical protein CcCBS67573_g10228 [Chytriomyces confervae]|uniref:Uncharacterized protein n=1 Tax=Chytriomyces confervae TaxID=246404 RepID=A0A507D8H0_9FUNG|nr:hypothetical protein CcCBS67573_g10228 [Chytriomyces confervae]